MRMLEVSAIWTAHVQQQNYRALLDAISHPGRVKSILHQQGGLASLAVLATLLDAEVSLADPDDLLEAEDWPLLQASAASPGEADYILCRGNRAARFQPKLGSLPSPERSATLIIYVDSLHRGELKLSLKGPGVNGNADCSIAGLDPDWIRRREEWVCGYPLGVDLLLVDDSAVLALPRTTKVEVA
ncbi:MAG: phosphonate C-P lyase system protein PhnH [Candidatus Thiodiazotropha sp. (ex Ctena orbiculata)]|nr:phosphonate C-P lyase system protein PhnH [Candidatus Thiodiazotropha taylori]